MKTFTLEFSSETIQKFMERFEELEEKVDKLEHLANRPYDYEPQKELCKKYNIPIRKVNYLRKAGKIHFAQPIERGTVLIRESDFKSVFCL